MPNYPITLHPEIDRMFDLTDTRPIGLVEIAAQRLRRASGLAPSLTSQRTVSFRLYYFRHYNGDDNAEST